ncbi:hypothetical protein Csa_003737 [Cucumis sativus]|uniref:Uncharacterized protein n=1 Tax=Cucumis sativus TaxID=3659 RepID=A0A0A0KJ46_CUCSA|nr:hypothetical protein Csa_003737 [Cucumis sativus]
MFQPVLKWEKRHEWRTFKSYSFQDHLRVKFIHSQVTISDNTIPKGPKSILRLCYEMYFYDAEVLDVVLVQ